MKVPQLTATPVGRTRVAVTGAAVGETKQEQALASRDGSTVEDTVQSVTKLGSPAVTTSVTVAGVV